LQDPAGILQDPAIKGPFLLQDLAFVFLQDGFFWVAVKARSSYLQKAKY